MIEENRFQLVLDFQPNHKRVIGLKNVKDHLAYRDAVVTFEGGCCGELSEAFKTLLFGSTDEVIATAFQLRGIKKEKE